MTIFTSLPAFVHGVTGGGTTPKVPVTTVAEAFRAAGYRTAAFTEDGPLAHERGFALGFDEYTENKSASLLSPSGQVDRTFGQVRAWLARHADEPFFVFAHTFQVHAPYAPPAAYAALFAADPPTPADPRGTEPARNYDREIRYVDDELRSLVGWLDARRLVERTLLVITADHGEEFYEHGSLGHGTLPWEEVLRVPLVMVGPGVPAGRREPAPAHHLDLMPTLLALAAIPPPEGLYGRNVASWTGSADPRSERDPLFSASWALPAGLLLPAVAVRLGDAKLVRHRDAKGERIIQLFDLRADPAEHDVIRDPETERALGRLLDGWAADTANDARRRRATVPTPAAAGPALDPARENKLRSLGYVE
jgi:arylsulfatase A-like enzyme